MNAKEALVSKIVSLKMNMVKHDQTQAKTDCSDLPICAGIYK
jgi:hypothetical protein